MPGAWLHYFGCGCMGMLTSFVFIASTQYNTDYAYVPVPALVLNQQCAPPIRCPLFPLLASCVSGDLVSW